ncbi:hypothetical protein CDAR_583541 [Caerostris darwini]|uniref:Uncharacterized protein n=1 Tax=Caerostris darwini TaxID=1538125 RepID=A0AAV4PTC5_9ARAC|nr:hypothetical protein CDAR_583541 [Caerostris darwini]
MIATHPVILQKKRLGVHQRGSRVLQNEGFTLHPPLGIFIKHVSSSSPLSIYLRYEISESLFQAFFARLARLPSHLALPPVNTQKITFVPRFPFKQQCCSLTSKFLLCVNSGETNCSLPEVSKVCQWLSSIFLNFR